MYTPVFEVVTEVNPGIRLARGVCRMLMDEGFSVLTEFPTKSGRRMDVLALGPSGELWCVEVKSSRADFQADHKWQDYLDWCDRLYFAVPPEFPEDLLPLEHGLIRTDEYDAEIIRQTTDDKLAAARRKAVTLRFARLAADRLERCVPNRVDRMNGEVELANGPQIARSGQSEQE